MIPDTGKRERKNWFLLISISAAAIMLFIFLVNDPDLTALLKLAEFFGY